MNGQLGQILCSWVVVWCSVGQVTIDDFAVPLPEGVRANWDLSSAFREQTPTRERICINGLWRWQPAAIEVGDRPHQPWGYFKVPGCWPGITDYMQKDSQTIYVHPKWIDWSPQTVAAAWYEREVTIPESWRGRRIGLSVDGVNSLAVVFVDGHRVGELAFPGGHIDLDRWCIPGRSHRLTLHVAALPLKAVLLSYADSNSARQVPGRVDRRGLCGDVFLVSEPVGERIAGVQVVTSYRRREIRFRVALDELSADDTYRLHATAKGVDGGVTEFASPAFRRVDVPDGRFEYAADWLPERLWDVHTPGNLYQLTLELRKADGTVSDVSISERFGFRELWIDGKDFYLNGSRIFLSAVPLDNAQVSAASATYEAARESLRRLKSFGINFVYTHNYGCEPGSHLAFTEILRAADDEGILVALSQPHFSHYEWHDAQSAANNGYARHAAYYAGVAGNHPSVVAYSMSHNACGYEEDMNPDLIDGKPGSRSPGYGAANAERAMTAESIVRQLDSSRIVYHHAAGNLGAMHTVNFYPNFVPIQEMSDWFQHWAQEGVKPLFLCEYAAPFMWDWAMYRGWYRGEREFGSAEVPWDFCLAEWSAQFLGDAAYRIGEAEKSNLRWEAEQFREGRVWHRWDYPYHLNSEVFDQRYDIIRRYITDNWRAFRTWEVSAISPWDYEGYWRLRPGVDRSRRPLRVEWQSLQRPGFSPDYLGQRYERIDLAYEAEDWEPTAAAQALLRHNLPLLSYIAGKPEAFTSREHVFMPSESFTKQAVVVNNSRQTVDCECRWSLGLTRPVTGMHQVTVETGRQVRVPMVFTLPVDLAAGSYPLNVEFRFRTGEIQTDTMTIQVVEPVAGVRMAKDPALFDPQGLTEGELKAMGIKFHKVQAEDDLSGYDQLIIGRGALTVDGPAPDVSRVRDGLRVVVMEQSAEVLEKRFGFRVVQYGLRTVFSRIPDHSLLDGIDASHLSDWRGSASLLPPRLEYTLRPRYGPTVKWCDIDVTRLWRCGNRGNVASVLIEKPARGDFRPVVDGGFGLQYSPLLEYREGRGMIVFCQLDVTARTESDPVARRVVHNLVAYADSWQPATIRHTVYVGDAEGRDYLTSAGFDLRPYEGPLAADDLLVLGPGCAESLAADTASWQRWRAEGGRVVAIGLDQADANLLERPPRMSRGEYIAGWFAPLQHDSPFSGVSPAEVFNRDPREIPLVTGGMTTYGGGVLAVADEGRTVCCQLVPWQFDGAQPWNEKKTRRRSAFLVTRILSNQGAASSTPILERLHVPVVDNSTPRWQSGLYLDQPEEWDDPYRFFRW